MNGEINSSPSSMHFGHEGELLLHPLSVGCDTALGHFSTATVPYRQQPFLAFGHIIILHPIFF